LVLALALSAVLSLLVLQFGWGAKSQVERATDLSRRIDAELALRSDQSRLFFQLMTQSWVAETEQPPQFHFDGRPFRIGGTTFCVQDLTGLVAFPGRRDSPDEFRRLLEIRLASPAQARSIIESLQRYYSGGGVQSTVQSLRVLPAITSLTLDDVDWLERYMTLYPTTDFNPLTAPETVLALRTPRYADEILSLRRNGELNRENFRALIPDFPSDFVRFFPGPGVRIDSVTEMNGVRLSRRQELTLLSGAGLPIAVWSNSQIRAESKCQL
jgi:hypothetical protein